MALLLRLFWLVAITWLFVAGIKIGALVLALIYLALYTSYELVVLAILLDAYYFAFFDWPVLSLVTLGLVFLADFIKPRLLMYTKDNASIS